MRVKTGETVTSSIKVDVMYKCSSCGKTNLSTQHVSGQGYTGTIFGIPLSDHYKASREDLKQNLDYILKSTDPMRFHRAHFNCVCSHCKKMEPWTNTGDGKMGVLFEICLTVFIFLFLGITANLRHFLVDMSPLNLILLVPMALSGGFCLYKLITNHQAKKRTIEKISKLPEESIPKLYPYSEELHNQLLRLIEQSNPSKDEKPKPAAASKNWTCPRCKRGNVEKNAVCWSCGYEQPSS